MDISVSQDPTGSFVAIDSNNYDVDCDHTGFFTKSPTGYGRTPLNAIVDLLDAIEPVLTVESYYNPTLPGSYGKHAYDNNGNHGFGRTVAEAIADYNKERK